MYIIYINFVLLSSLIFTLSLFPQPQIHTHTGKRMEIGVYTAYMRTHNAQGDKKIKIKIKEGQTYYYFFFLL